MATPALQGLTSIRHVLQQRVVKLPKGVRREIAALDEAAESGDEAVGGCRI